MAYGDSDHRCEVSRRDLDSLRYDLERAIQEAEHRIAYLQQRIDSMREDIRSLIDSRNSGG